MKQHKDQIDKDLDREDIMDWAVLIVGAVLMATAVALQFVGPC